MISISEKTSYSVDLITLDTNLSNKKYNLMQNLKILLYWIAFYIFKLVGAVDIS